MSRKFSRIEYRVGVDWNEKVLFTLRWCVLGGGGGEEVAIIRLTCTLHLHAEHLSY